MTTSAIAIGSLYFATIAHQARGCEGSRRDRKCTGIGAPYVWVAVLQLAPMVPPRYRAVNIALPIASPFKAGS